MIVVVFGVFFSLFWGWGVVLVVRRAMYKAGEVVQWLVPSCRGVGFEMPAVQFQGL